MSFNTSNYSFRKKNINSNLQKTLLTLIKYIKFNELSNNNKSKLFLKNKTIEESSNNSLLIKNKENYNLTNNLEDNDDLFLKTTVISENKKFGLIEIISIYNSILNKLNILLKSYNAISCKYIFSLLIKIKNFIYNIIDEKKFIINLSRNDYSNEISNIKKYKYKTNIYNIKKYNSFYSRNNNYSAFQNYKNRKNSTSIQKNIEINESNIIPDNQNNNIRKIKYLRRKIANIENKFKIEELNYLFCIGEQNKKISKLEKEINLNNVDNMSKEELRKYKCFPNYIKFDVIDDYSQKLNNLKEKKNQRNKCYSSFEQRRNLKNNFSKEQNNDNINKKNGKENIKENKLEENLNKIEDDNKRNTIKIIKNYKEEKKNINDIFKKTKEIIECGKKNFNKEDLFITKYFDKKKNFFISHPKLNYVKYGSEGLHMKTWKINDILETLPKKISKYKFNSKSQKNSIIVFPSSLNETVVNLEKLRVNKNFRSIEVKFKENRKVNKLKNIYNEI